MLRECVSNRAKVTLNKSRGLADSYRPDGLRTTNAIPGRGREPPRSVPFAYEGGSSRHRSRSPGRSSNSTSNHGESLPRYSRSRSPRGRSSELGGGDRSSTSSYRTRSPRGDDRKLISYADIDSPTSRVYPATSKYSDGEIRRYCAHDARPKYVSMKEADSTKYYEFSKGEFKIGTIIRGPVHEEDTNRTPRDPYATSGMSEYQASRIRSHVSHTPQGAVWSESRFLIVVDVFASHYMAVPLFTYEGTGLRHKEDRSEYVSIQDHRYPGSCRGEAPHILDTGYLAPSVKPIKPTTVAHLMAPVVRKYKWHVKYQGRLSKDATDLLIQLYNPRGRG